MTGVKIEPATKAGLFRKGAWRSAGGNPCKAGFTAKLFNVAGHELPRFAPVRAEGSCTPAGAEWNMTACGLTGGRHGCLRSIISLLEVY